MWAEFFDKLLAIPKSQSFMHDAEDMASVERQLINLERTRQIENNRAGVRLNSRVPVIVEWDTWGQTFRVEGTTKDTSPRGCLVIAAGRVAVGQRLKLVNRINQKSCEAVVVWQGEDSQANWELGLELQEPGSEFWGLDL